MMWWGVVGWGGMQQCVACRRRSIGCDSFSRARSASAFVAMRGLAFVLAAADEPPVRVAALGRRSLDCRKRRRADVAAPEQTRCCFS